MCKPKYLVMVTPENNNKYYRMIPQGDTFSVEYGRIGVENFQKASYSMSQWDKKYYEKIKKGYQDKTDLVEELIEKEQSKGQLTNKEIINQAIAKIVQRLQDMANKAIQENYTISSNVVTQAMVDNAQEILIDITNSTTLESFNENLLKLFTTIPRKMKHVKEHLARDTNDFADIIQTEQDLLDVMAGQIYKKPLVQTQSQVDVINVEQKTILEELGLHLEETTPKEIQMIKKQLGDQSYKYYNSWKVVNNNTQERFDTFIKKNNIKETKLLFHGSRNENFWSIIKGGLVLKPTNVVITGKMFGNGCYHALDAGKSIGYTSLNGSRWANGNSNSAFMALFDVAYGTPFIVYNFDSKFYNLNYDKLQDFQKGAHCLHAKSDKGMLRADEIVVYKEEQMTIKYLIELKK